MFDVFKEGNIKIEPGHLGQVFSTEHMVYTKQASGGLHQTIFSGFEYLLCARHSGRENTARSLSFAWVTREVTQQLQCNAMNAVQAAFEALTEE